MTRFRVIYTGRVQGVFFRSNCQKKARELDLNGWVKNRSDGSVEMVVQGPEGKCRELIEWNRTSQPRARVDDVEVKKEEEGEPGSFRIVR